MYSRLTEQDATRRTAELTTATRQARQTRAAVRQAAAGQPHHTGHPLRQRTGWALVSVGLWLASEGR
jgi:hypothetical protein